MIALRMGQQWQLSGAMDQNHRNRIFIGAHDTDSIWYSYVGSSLETSRHIKTEFRRPFCWYEGGWWTTVPGARDGFPIGPLKCELTMAYRLISLLWEPPC
jgi:hypothetical protein